MKNTISFEESSILKRLKYNKVLYLLIFSLILISDDTFLFGTSGLPGIETFKYAYLFIITCILAFHCKLSHTQLCYIALFLVLFNLSSIFNGSGISGGPFLLCCVITCGYAISNILSLKGFSRIFSDIIYVINIYSMLVWAMAIIGIAPLSMSENVAGAPILKSFGCIFFDYKIALRNSAIFREPGMYMIFISFAYILEAFVLKKNVTGNRLLVYCISIFSTFSTAGYIIFFLLYLISILNLKNFSWKKILSTIIIVAVIIFLMGTDYSEIVFGKLEKGEESASYLGRISSITIPLEMIWTHPILGCGISDFSDLYRSIAIRQYGIDIKPEGMATNTILNASSVFGIWFGIFLLWGFWKFSQKLRLSKILKLAIYICFILALSNEVIMYSTFTYWFIGYGFSKWRA